MKYVLCLILLCCGVYGQQVDITKLPEAERAAIQQKIQQTQQIQSEITPQKISEWAEVGKAVGVAIGATAKELNLEVNNFAQTPVGRLTMALVIWKVLGGTILGMILGLLLLSIGIYWVSKLYDERFLYVYEQHPIFFGLINRTIVKEKNLKDRYTMSEGQWFCTIIAIVITAVGIVVSIVTLSNA
jgi:hypothetical protein